MSAKISTLTSGGAAIGTDLLPIARAGSNYSLTVAAIAAFVFASSPGASGQVLYNSGGAVAGSSSLTFDGTTLTAGGFAGPLTGNVTGNVSGNATTATAAFSATTLSATLTPDKGGTGVANNVANTLTFSGNFGLTLTLSGTTSVTLPTSGTLLTTASLATQLASPPAIGGTAANAGTFTVGTFTATTLGALKVTAIPGDSTGTVQILNDTSGLLRPSFIASNSTGGGGSVALATYGNGGIGNGPSIGTGAVFAQSLVLGNGAAPQAAVGAASAMLGFNSGSNAAIDLAIKRNTANVLEINNGTAGTFADLKLRTLIAGGTMATNMTVGFIQIAGAAGAATGTPADTSGVPMYFDKTNNKLMAYNAGWKTLATAFA
jgi:hypothetical protein